MAQSHIATACHSQSLADVLERVLDKGLVIAGDIKIKICDIELLTIQIRLLIASVDKAREMGLTWWWQEPHGSGAPHELPHEQASRAALAAETPWEQYQQFRQFAEQAKQHIIERT